MPVRRCRELTWMWWFQCSVAGLVCSILALRASADELAGAVGTQCVLVEIYTQGDGAAEAAVRAARQLQATRGGISVIVRDVEAEPQNRQRLAAIARHYQISERTTPVIYTCNRLLHGLSDEVAWSQQLRQALQLEVFVRQGCSHCAAAKAWLPGFLRRYPGLQVVYHDLVTEAGASSRLSALVREHHTMAASVPVFHLCNTVRVGFDGPGSAEDRLQSVLKRWVHDCPRARPQPADKSTGTSQAMPHRPPQMRAQLSQGPSAPALSPRVLRQAVVSRNSVWSDSLAHGTATSMVATVIVLPSSGVCCTLPHFLTDDQGADKPDQEPRTEPLSTEPPPTEAEAMDELPVDELPLPGDLPLPGELPLPGADDEQDGGEQSDQIDLPLFGTLSAGQLGMPVFTIAVGLVDGFNPCAMWVLLFLLSILVNLQDRVRILAIAGTFVLVSGAAYFAFMAAWLNVFMLIGIVRPVQVGLALLAIVIGSIHVKDFVALKKGISLSIPESAKPGIYARVRRIVTAEHLPGAVAGAVTLAVLVNIIELLCTAGLPALYTNILMQQGFSAPVRYAYLGLYNVAYMFDDSLMVGAVVITLSKRRLQETQGRWLKLISGLAILLLGIVMLLRPDWLR